WRAPLMWRLLQLDLRRAPATALLPPPTAVAAQSDAQERGLVRPASRRVPTWLALRLDSRPAAPRRSGRRRFLQLREACIRASDVTFRLLVSMRAAPIAATCDRVTPRVVPATRGDLRAVSPAGDNSRARQQAVAQHRAPVWKAEA